jgi:hypothetical protein
MIGGMKETQDCMDFCAKHNILPATKVSSEWNGKGAVQLLLSAVQAGITLVTELQRERGASSLISAAFFGEISQMLARNATVFSILQIFLVICTCYIFISLMK